MRPPYGVGKEKIFRDMGYQIHGTVQVGVNDGTELGWFLQEGQVPIIGFEPIPEVFDQTCNDFAEDIFTGKIYMFQLALGEVGGLATLNIPAVTGGENTGGASILRELSTPEYGFARSITVPVVRFDDFIDGLNMQLDGFDLLYVDVQGMELQVLKGFGKYLQTFKFLNIECSEQPLYEGEASAAEVCSYLTSQGFLQQTPILSHNDILFLKAS
jgi:FkbM family methyltransferase